MTSLEWYVAGVATPLILGAWWLVAIVLVPRPRPSASRDLSSDDWTRFRADRRGGPPS